MFATDSHPVLLPCRPIQHSAGGNFIWPGVEVGHVQTVHGLETLGSIDMKTLSMEPLM